MIKTTKFVIIDFLRRIFDANARGLLDFKDGDRAIKFTSRPRIIQTDEWDRRIHPVVLIGSASGPIQKFDLQDFKDVGDFITLGGYAELSLTLSGVAKTKEERDDLIDVVAVYLSRPDARTFLQANGVVLPKPPSFDGETSMDVPTTDYKLYQTDLGLQVNVEWEEAIAVQRISKIFLESVELYDSSIDP